VTYTHAAVGDCHTVLLRSDGQAVACGDNRCGQCDIPELDDTVTYTHAVAGSLHTVLLRSDGQAVACGYNHYGQCDIPELSEGSMYVTATTGPSLIVQAVLNNDSIAFTSLDSATMCNIPYALTDRLSAVLAQFQREAGFNSSEFQVVLSSGELLSELLVRDPRVEIRGIL